MAGRAGVGAEGMLIFLLRRFTEFLCIMDQFFITKIFMYHKELIHYAGELIRTGNVPKVVS